MVHIAIGTEVEGIIPAARVAAPLRSRVPVAQDEPPEQPVALRQRVVTCDRQARIAAFKALDERAPVGVEQHNARALRRSSTSASSGPGVRTAPLSVARIRNTARPVTGSNSGTPLGAAVALASATRKVALDPMEITGTTVLASAIVKDAIARYIVMEAEKKAYDDCRLQPSAYPWSPTGFRSILDVSRAGVTPGPPLLRSLRFGVRNPVWASDSARG